MTQERETQPEKNQKRRGPGIFKVIQGIAAGALGVQSSKRREEDFASQSPWPYIIGALLFTSAFIGTLILIVQAVLSGH